MNKTNSSALQEIFLASSTNITLLVIEVNSSLIVSTKAISCFINNLLRESTYLLVRSLIFILLFNKKSRQMLCISLLCRNILKK